MTDQPAPFLLAGLSVAGILLLAATIVSCGGQPEPSPDVRVGVMTFNIRYANPDDGIHRWELRKDWVGEIIRNSDADVVGLQEALRHQIDSLMTRLPAYGWVGQGRDDGRNAGEFSPVLYRKDRLELLSTGTYWLSETPDVTGSRGWDAALPRIVTWAAFRNRRTGLIFYHFNTHFDHRGPEARRESAHLLRTRIPEIAGEAPFIVTGDFNAVDSSAVYRELTRKTEPDLVLTDSRSAATADADPTTFRGFEPGSAEERRIDYVFASDAFSIESHRVLDEARDGSYPSDHLPVLARLIVTLGTL